MAVLKSTFVDLANTFMDDTFADFRKPLIMRTADAVEFGVDQAYTLEPVTGSNFGIPLTLNFSLFDLSMIEVGDFLIFTNVSQWTTDPKADNVDLIFDGVAMQIILVDKDPADAAYFLTVRRK